MKSLLALTALAATVVSLSAQEKLPREESLRYAAVLTNYTKQMQAAPIATHPDLAKPVAVREENYGGMALPELKLSADTFAKAGKEVTPVGQLWMLKLSPLKDGQVVPVSKLHMVHVSQGDQEVDVSLNALGVRKAEAGGLELLVYGKAATPVLTVPLKTISATQEDPIDISAERQDDGGLITLKFVGKYQATFKVTDPDLY